MAKIELSKTTGTNTRGGIDKVSSRERDGIVASGSTGTTEEILGTPTPTPTSTSGEVGVVSSVQGEETFKDLDRKFNLSGPETGLTDLEQAREKDAQTKRFSGLEGTAEQDLFDEGTQKAVAAKGGRDNTTTYINPGTDQTETTTGPTSGSEEERAKFAAEGFEVSEATTTVDEEEDPEIQRLTEEIQRLTEVSEAATAEVTNMINRVNDLYITDSRLRSQVLGITNAYDARIAEMQDITKRQVASIRTTGIRSGARFTGGSGGLWGGIISEAERQGVLRIADIESKKQSTIIEAKNAARNFNYTLASDLLDSAETLAANKATELANLQEAQREQDAAIAEKKRRLEIDTNISALVAEGETNINNIFDRLNRDENGDIVGDVSLEEIQSALEIANPNADLAGLDSDYRTYITLKESGEFTGDWEAYQIAQERIKHMFDKPSPGDIPEPVVVLTPENKRSLAAVGISGTDIADIQRAINDFGLEQVIANGEFSEAQEAAIRAALSDAGATFLDRDFIKTEVTIDELETAAAKAGYTEGGFLGIGVGRGEGEGVDDYLDFLEATIEAYRAQGNSDAEIRPQILKMIKDI
jgi:hypothetical protein